MLQQKGGQLVEPHVPLYFTQSMVSNIWMLYFHPITMSFHALSSHAWEIGSVFRAKRRPFLRLAFFPRCGHWDCAIFRWPLPLALQRGIGNIAAPMQKPKRFIGPLIPSLFPPYSLLIPSLFPPYSLLLPSFFPPSSLLLPSFFPPPAIYLFVGLKPFSQNNRKYSIFVLVPVLSETLPLVLPLS